MKETESTQKDELDYIKFAKEFISSYYQSLASKDQLNHEGYIEILNINNDENVLLEHCIALKNILEKAIEELKTKN